MTIVLKEEFEHLSADMKDSILEASIAAEKFGVDIFLIGGIVRDFIMSNPIKDIDIAVQGDAVEFVNYLKENSKCEVISVQEKLRTAKVKFESGVEIDFASTRQERYSQSGFLPEAYNFGCELKEDVKRRDFTINTLALKLTGQNKYQLVDYYNGYQDILNKQIKILHENSFIDDPSRIIRALKFKIRFDFNIEERTYSLMQQYLENVSSEMPLERIKNELCQYFSIKKENIYDEIISTNAYKLISENPIKNVDLTRIKTLIDFNIYNEDEFWFLLICCLLINSDFNNERLNMTAFEKKVLTETKELLNSGKIKLNDNEKIYKLFNNKIDLSIALYYLLTGEECVLKFLGALKQIQVLINGNDLIELGFIPSSYFSELFDKVLKEKLKGKLRTKEEELKFVSKFIKKQSR